MTRFQDSWYWGILSLIMIAVAAAFLTISPQQRFYPECIIHNTTGVECPACGSSRSLHALAHGKIRTALAYNPFVASGWPLLTVYAAFMFFAGGEPRRSETHRKWRKRLVTVFLWLWLAFTLVRNFV